MDCGCVEEEYQDSYFVIDLRLQVMNDVVAT